MTTITTVLLGLAAAVAAGASEVVDLDDVHPGQTGVCVTEMDGGERVEIPLTVLGTVGSGAPDGDIVLVRLDDERFEKTGIIGGMSGSPVYVEGRLVGALAYGWAFAKEPIGGVTPFGRMLEVQPMQPPANRSSDLVARPTFAQLVGAAVDGSLGDLVVDWLLPKRTMPLSPLPLVVSAMGTWSPTGSGWLAESWRRMGWVAAPGGTGTPPEEESLTPGAMVAGVLVDGDVKLAAAGTITEIRGDDLWAFGHAFLGVGTARIPLARAHVVAVLPSQQNSFKFVSVAEPIGELVADRTHGVVGRLGSAPPMVPISVKVNRRDYSFRAVRHPVLLPVLVAYLGETSHRAFGQTFGVQTVTTEIEVGYHGGLTAATKAAFTGGDAVTQAAAFNAAVIAYLEGSSFSVPEMESLAIHLRSDENIRQGTIVDVVPERTDVQPGEVLRVRFRIRPYRGPEEQRTVTIRIPDGVPEGRLDLVAADGASWTAYDLQMRPLVAAGFADEVRLVNSLVPSSTLVVALERQDAGMSVAGGSLSTPPSIVLELEGALGPNLRTTSYSIFARSSFDLEDPVIGAQRIPLSVSRRE